MKPAVVLALLLGASTLHAESAQELFNEAVYSTCPREQVELLTDALNKDPGLEMGHHNLGAAYYRLGELEKAITVLKMALLAQPTYPNTHYLLSCCYSRTGETSLALSHLRKAIRYGWDEGDMVNADSDLDAIRGGDFPRVSSHRGRHHRGSSRASGGSGKKRHRGGSAAAAAAAPSAPSGQPDDQPASLPPPAAAPDQPAAPPQAPAQTPAPAPAGGGHKKK